MRFEYLSEVLPSISAMVIIWLKGGINFPTNVWTCEEGGTMAGSAERLGVKFFVVVTFIAMVVVNFLAQSLPINGVTPGEVSDSYPNLFAPAGVTFSIWGIIYLLLGIFTLYQLGLFQGEETVDDDLLKRVGIIFSLSSLMNVAWIFSWHFGLIPLSMFFMVGILLSLIMIARAIDASRLTMRERVFVRLPFGVYFGWITIATIANATVLLVSLGFKGVLFSEAIWTVIILLVGAAIGVLTLLRFRCIAYGLVLMWGYTGILIKHLSASPAGFAGEYTMVIITLTLCLVVFLGAIVDVLPEQVTQLRRKKTYA